MVNSKSGSDILYMYYLQEAQQRTGLWQKFDDVRIEASKDINNVRLEIGPGYRWVVPYKTTKLNKEI